MREWRKFSQANRPIDCWFLVVPPSAEAHPAGDVPKSVEGDIGAR
jgi:hypothetical protein